MGHPGVLLLRGGAHALAMLCVVPCKGFGLFPIVVRRPQGLLRLILSLLFRIDPSLLLPCPELFVCRIPLGLLLGRFLGSGGLLLGLLRGGGGALCNRTGALCGSGATPDGLTGMLGALLYGRLAQGAEQAADRAGDAPAQGPEAGRGLPLHVAYPGGLRDRGERPRREGPRVYRVGREREKRAHEPPGPLARQDMSPIGYPRVPSHHSPLPPLRRRGKQDRYRGTPRDGRWDAPAGATSPHQRTPPRRPAVSFAPIRPGRGWAYPRPTGRPHTGPSGRRWRPP